MGEWVELRISTASWERIARLVPEAQMTYHGGVADGPNGQRTIHVWPEQPSGGRLAKLILIDEASVVTQPGAEQ